MAIEQMRAHLELDEEQMKIAAEEEKKRRRQSRPIPDWPESSNTQG